MMTQATTLACLAGSLFAGLFLGVYLGYVLRVWHDRQDDNTRSLRLLWPDHTYRRPAKRIPPR